MVINLFRLQREGIMEKQVGRILFIGLSFPFLLMVSSCQSNTDAHKYCDGNTDEYHYAHFYDHQYTDFDGDEYDYSYDNADFYGDPGI